MQRLITERSWSFAEYRFGMNGQVEDDEIYGDGNSTSAEFWQYDSRLGRSWNVDPVVKFWQSPYITFSDNPMNKIDIQGDDDFFDRNGKLERRIHMVMVIPGFPITWVNIKMFNKPICILIMYR